MNEGKKTGIFWAAAVVMMAIAMIVAWPPAQDNSGGVEINQALFKEFKDPLVAASLKIVTFDEEQGQLDTFEVRKDRETGAWTIPSRQGYPADAVDQMKDAANALVDLKILDIQTSNPEDHSELGVAEPSLEDLEIGDEGVGRLVTLKDESQKTLASLIIGDSVKDREGQRYVRKPGQDPVYVVKLDVTPITTDFQKWIEDDLLQLSSIDVEQMEIKDYNAALNLGGQISLTRNYTADVSMDGSQWKLDKLQEYNPENPLADPKTVQVSEDEKLNATRLNEIKNALDDLKIVDVVRKPEGMSANLRADKDLASDSKAVSSLASRGFYPVPIGPQGEYEVLSANGELTAGLKDGVQYVMRFGNIAGLGDEQDSSDDEAEEKEEKSSVGVNRYLLVTTRVDESKFPAPELKPIPQTLEELDALLNPVQPQDEKPEGEGLDAKESKQADEKSGEDKASSEESRDKAKEPAEAEKNAENSDQPDSAEKPSEAKPADSEKGVESTDAAESSNVEKSADEPADAKPAGESEGSGSGEASGTGRGQEPEQEESSQGNDQQSDQTNGDEKDSTQSSVPDEASGAKSKKADTASKDESSESVEAGKSGDEKSADDAPAKDGDAKGDVLSEEEKQERLEAEQEKITKENQRLMDERKDKLEAARKRVKDLNARFADWYYVIPEETYSKLRISRDDLIEKPTSDAPETSLPPGDGVPQFNFGPPK